MYETIYSRLQGCTILHIHTCLQLNKPSKQDPVSSNRLGGYFFRTKLPDYNITNQRLWANHSTRNIRPIQRLLGQSEHP